MHPTKELLIERNGLRCMLCGREFPYKFLNRHHIRPKEDCKRKHEPIDDSYENGAMLCLDCHALVHCYKYGSWCYERFMEIIKHNKK